MSCYFKITIYKIKKKVYNKNIIKVWRLLKMSEKERKYENFVKEVSFDEFNEKVKNGELNIKLKKQELK